jgi:2-isopropylmalate synthase
MNGLGERAGNAALEEVVMALKTRKDYYPTTTRIVTEKLYRTSSMVSLATGVHVQPNKAIVGANAFAHEAGIHQHGMMSNSQTYEIMTPESIGLKQSQMVLGKHSGRHAFEEKLKELGYNNLAKEEVNKAFMLFKDLADKKKHIMDRDIEALITEESRKASETYKLEYFQITSGSDAVSTATVKISSKLCTNEEAACGDGPVDAVFNAIDRATGRKVKLEEYSIKASTGGNDALGEVTVKVSEGNLKAVGYGVSTNIIEASAKAYINAINHMESRLEEPSKNEMGTFKIAASYNYFGAGDGEKWI